MNIKQLIDNKNTMNSLTKKLHIYKKEYDKSKSFLDKTLDIVFGFSVFSLIIITSLLCILSVDWFKESFFYGYLLIPPASFLFLFIYITLFAKLRDLNLKKIEKNNMTCALNWFKGEGFHFKKYDVIQKTIHSLSKKEKDLFNKFIFFNGKNHYFNFDNKILETFFNDKKEIIKYKKEDMLDIVNIIKDAEKKSKLLNLIMENTEKNNNQIDINNKIILEI